MGVLGVQMIVLAPPRPAPRKGAAPSGKRSGISKGAGRARRALSPTATMAAALGLPTMARSPSAASVSGVSLASSAASSASSAQTPGGGWPEVDRTPVW